MRDSSKSRAGFDRVLMAVAATFLTVSATSAFAQADPARNSPAELAIDAAIPRPEPANVPPPTASDFKLDTTASVPDPASPSKAMEEATRAIEKAAATKPADVAVPAKTDNATASPPHRLPVSRRRPPSPPRSRSRLQAASRRQTSPSPTSCAT
jgi:hypothetical protein